MRKYENEMHTNSKFGSNNWKPSEELTWDKLFYMP